MTSTVVGLTWAALVLALAWRRRPLPPRVRLLVGGSRGATATRRDVPARLGAAIRRRAGREPDPAADRRLGRAVVVAVPAALVLGPVPGAAAALAAWVLPWWSSRRRAHGRQIAVGDELPDAVELLLLAVDAGLTPRLSLQAVADHLPGTTGEAFGAVIGRTELGVRLADALDVLVDRLGDPVRPLVAVLADADRYGSPLRPGLERVAAESRDDRRRRAEAAARRVPVKLLFPLVCCTLPAFALVTVVPLLAGSLDALSF